MRTKPDELHFVVNTFTEVTDFYRYPFPSSKIGIVAVRNISPDCKLLPVDHVHKKCIALPFSENEFVVVPMCHSEQ